MNTSPAPWASARVCVCFLLLTAWGITSTPATAAEIDARFVQVHPLLAHPEKFIPSLGRSRAVVLLHGLHLQLHLAKVERADFSSWQKPGSKLVLALAPEADVFSFLYSQNTPVDAVAKMPALRDGIRRLREAGYTDIVLIGHSAGGLIARHFVEDHPTSGITKVIQVCTPNGGCGYAKLEWLCKNQRPFVDSLGKPARRIIQASRSDRVIPLTVQFVCVVGTAAGVGDLIVSDSSQWPKDLRDQGIPALRWWTGHFWVTRNSADAKKIADLVRADHPRWDAIKVEAMKKKILGG